MRRHSELKAGNLSISHGRDPAAPLAMTPSHNSAVLDSAKPHRRVRTDTLPDNMSVKSDAAHSMSPPIDEQIRRVLARHPYIRAASLFGSLAAGGARPQSDLDLAVLADKPLSAEKKAALIEGLAADSGRPIDLVDLATAGEPLLGQLLCHGRRLLGDDIDHAQLIRRHVFEEADCLPYRNRILAERRPAWIGK